MLRDIIKTYLVQKADVDPAKFDQPDLMVADLGLDSLGLVEMLFEIEDRFGFQIPDAMGFQALSFDAMVGAVEKAVRDHHGGELPDLEKLSSSPK